MKKLKGLKGKLMLIGTALGITFNVFGACDVIGRVDSRYILNKDEIQKSTLVMNFSILNGKKEERYRYFDTINPFTYSDVNSNDEFRLDCSSFKTLLKKGRLGIYIHSLNKN